MCNPVHLKGCYITGYITNLIRSPSLRYRVRILKFPGFVFYLRSFKTIYAYFTRLYVLKFQFLLFLENKKLQFRRIWKYKNYIMSMLVVNYFSFAIEIFLPYDFQEASQDKFTIRTESSSI